MSLSDATLKAVADELFLLRTPKPPPLPKPVNTDTGFTSRFEPIGADPRFKDFGIGVIDFTSDVQNPNVWLHNGDDPWPVWSTTKIAILLAAVQLRDDVRRVAATGAVSSPADLDEAFARVWSRSKNPHIKQIRLLPPRISTIFDLDLDPIDFDGADTAIDWNDIQGRMPASRHLTWGNSADFSFHEKLWLAGTRSDNVAAGACTSEIGIEYIKAVQRGYGLFDDGTAGMCLFLSGMYAGKGLKALAPNFPRVSRKAGAPRYRAPPSRFESQWVFAPFSGKPHTTTNTVGGSASALTAYMLALMQDKLIDKDACDAIRDYLSDTTSPGHVRDFMVEGVEQRKPVAWAYTKVGFVGSSDGDFAYLETPGPPHQNNFGIVAAGIRPHGVYDDDVELAHALAAEIFDRLTAAGP